MLKDLIAVMTATALLFGAAALMISPVEARSPSLRELYAGTPNTWPRPVLAEGADFTEFGLLPPMVHPSDNPTSPAKVALGERLFNERKLSGSGQLTCASCHSPELGFGDGLQTSFGHDRQRGTRNAQPLFVVGWMTPLFWDGRSSTLEEQAAAPLAHPMEMAGSPDQIEARLNADSDYRQAFEEVFGPGRITIARVQQALATFERSLKPRQTKYDRALREGTQVLTDEELLGLHLFRTKAGCASCHNGPLLSDRKFHNLGLTFYGRERQDLGRYEITRDPADVGAFRTPSLRNIRRTGPYMHNGLLPHLEGVVNFYNGGAAQPRPRPDQIDDPLFPQTSPMLKPLDLETSEREAIIAFLETL